MIKLSVLMFSRPVEGWVARRPCDMRELRWGIANGVCWFPVSIRVVFQCPQNHCFDRACTSFIN